MALGQETLTHSRRPRLQNSSSGHAKPLIATRVARFLPVLDKSDRNLHRPNPPSRQPRATSPEGSGSGAPLNAEAAQPPMSVVPPRVAVVSANTQPLIVPASGPL